MTGRLFLLDSQRASCQLLQGRPLFLCDMLQVYLNDHRVTSQTPRDTGSGVYRHDFIPLCSERLNPPSVSQLTPEHACL